MYKGTRVHTVKTHFYTRKRDKSLPSQRYQTALCTHGQRKENLALLLAASPQRHIYRMTPPPHGCPQKNPQKVPMRNGSDTSAHFYRLPFVIVYPGKEKCSKY